MGSKCVGVWTELSARRREAPRRRHAVSLWSPTSVPWTRQGLGRLLQGVINIDPNDTSISLKQKLRWKHGNILCVRKLGNTNVAVVTFEGKRVPRHVYCSDQVIPVRLYKKTIPACHRCGTVGHRADICPRPQSGRCGRCGSQVATTPEGPAEHECTPRCLICGGSHLTGAAECRDKYRKPIKPRLPPSNTKRTSAPKGTPSAGVNNKKKSPSTPGKPGQVKATENAETRKQAPPFNAWDFSSLENAQTKVRGWVGAASEPLSPSPTEVALQRQNAELRRHTEILAKKIHELEAKLARPQAQAGPSEPMQQTEPENLDDRASVASGLSSDSQCTAISVGNMPIMENRLETLERTIADMPGKILEGVRAYFREPWQRELPQIVESITPIVTDSVLSIVHGRTGVQFRNSRSRSRSPRPDTHRRTVAPRPTTGSEEHIPAASFPEMMVSLPEAPSPSGFGPAAGLGLRGLGIGHALGPTPEVRAAFGSLDVEVAEAPVRPLARQEEWLRFLMKQALHLPRGCCTLLVPLFTTQKASKWESRRRLVQRGSGQP
ncbi:hypothetical protein HPB50_009003 [Hyalomma asiaticum]|uniref:Uncharacterized protein n=1 Tax=Hyalomma asiaticum TaxID=266040 RepID=A0ACB7S5T6_HYAAI|nr:hypothetical protein HPB50_009003 [Hyalomma asiaticum]